MTREYQQLRETVANIINTSPLDIGGKYFVLKDLYRDVEIVYYSAINKEISQDNTIQEGKEHE